MRKIKSINSNSLTTIFTFWRFGKQDISQEIPLCPKCNCPMILREPRRGPNKGKKFYGCSNYPGCKETIRILV